MLGEVASPAYSFQALKVPISMHCWQADDIGGFEVKEAGLAGLPLCAWKGGCGHGKSVWPIMGSLACIF